LASDYRSDRDRSCLSALATSLLASGLLVSTNRIIHHHAAALLAHLQRAAASENGAVAGYNSEREHGSAQDYAVGFEALQRFFGCVDISPALISDEEGLQVLSVLLALRQAEVEGFAVGHPLCISPSNSS
jgi:hypothetical protein